MKKIRVSIFIIVTILLAFGTVMIYSSSGIYAHDKFHDSLFFLKRHLLFLGVGLVLSFVILALDRRTMKRFAKPVFFISVLLLALVLIPHLGSEISGARRWFKIGRFLFQPSELAKLTLIMYLADMLSKKGSYISDFGYGFLPALSAAGITVGLILIQPDLGTAVALGAIAFILFFAAGVKWKYLGGTVLAALPVIFLAVYKVSYRWKRVMAFLNPWSDPRGNGFQIIQSFLALGLGGVFGVGLGMSRQKLLYLPAAHTDFIFSIIGEELGFFGTMSVITLFILLFWQRMRVAFKSEDPYARFLSLGISSLIAVEAAVNIGVSIGALPTKGLPLPFISYGGSSLIFHMMGIALLLTAAKDR